MEMKLYCEQTPFNLRFPNIRRTSQNNLASQSLRILQERPNTLSKLKSRFWPAMRNIQSPQHQRRLHSSRVPQSHQRLSSSQYALKYLDRFLCSPLYGLVQACYDMPRQKRRSMRIAKNLSHLSSHLNERFQNLVVLPSFMIHAAKFVPVGGVCAFFFAVDFLLD